MRDVRGGQDDLFEDQIEGWWSRVNKAVIRGDVGEEGARPHGALNALGRNVSVFISTLRSHWGILIMGDAQCILYLRMAPLAAGVEQTGGNGGSR